MGITRLRMAAAVRRYAKAWRSNAENGKGIKLEPMVAMLRVLNKLELLNSFETQAMTSPLLLAKKEGKTPQRIRPRHD